MSALDTIRAALEQLPKRCRYHSDEIEPTRNMQRFSGACCATGEPSLLRRRAEDALRALEPKEQR